MDAKRGRSTMSALITQAGQVGLPKAIDAPGVGKWQAPYGIAQPVARAQTLSTNSPPEDSQQPVGPTNQ